MIDTCRVCLCADRRMYAISNTVLQEMWEKLTNAKFNTNDGKPCLVCYICCAHLRKCSQLRKRALKAEELLTAFINNDLEQSQVTLSLPASLKNDLDSICFPNELFQFEYKQLETKYVEEIKIEYVEANDGDDYREENHIHFKQEEDSLDSYQEEYLDFDYFESSAVSRDDAPLTSTILNDILQTEEAPVRKHKLNKGLRNNNCKAALRSSSKKLSVYMNVESELDVNFKTEPNVNCSAADKISPKLNLLPKDNAQNELKGCLSKSTDVVAPCTSTDRSGKGNKSNACIKKGHKNDYSCPTCQYKCVTKRELKKHISKHTGKKYLCELCDYRSSHKGHLNIHIMHKHTKEKNFSCHFCQYKCVSNNQLNVHLRRHTGEKPFICHLCDYRSSIKALLRRHIKYKHTKEKNFSCHICQFKCVAKEYLNVHLRKHTGEQPYTCDVCDYKFAQRSNLRSHIKNKHTQRK